MAQNGNGSRAATLVPLEPLPPPEGAGRAPLSVPPSPARTDPAALRPAVPHFVGREEDIEHMRRELRAPVAVGGAFIISIAGVGGAGKTSLLKQFLRLRSPSAIYVCADDRDRLAGAAALARVLAQRLAAALGPHSHSARALAERHQFPARVDRVDTLATLDGPPGEAAPEDPARGRAEPAVAEDPLDLLVPLDPLDPADAVAGLTDALIRDVNAAGEAGKQVVLVLDTYEAIRHVAGPWLLDTLLGGRLTPLTGDLRLIVSGREPLQRTDPRWMRDWDTTDRAILNVDLEPFSVAETETYLGSDPQSEAAGRRPSPDDVHAAHRMTGGLPVWLALWRQAWRRAGESPDVAAAEHVQMVVDRLLMWWDDPAQLRWVRTAWAPRWFNLEILRVLLGPDAEPAFEWLTRQAAIVRGDRGRWRFHEVVRIALRHEALQRAPNELAALHDRLAEYWRGRTPASGRPAEEALYHHLLGTNPIQGAAAFCQAYVRGLAAGDPHLGRLVAAGREARAEAGPVAGLRTVAAVEAHWDALQAGDTARAAVLRDQIVALNVLPPAERALLLAERVDRQAGAAGAAALGRRPPAERPEPAEQRPRPWWRGLAGRRALTPEQRRHTEALVEYGDTLRLAGNYEAALAPLTAVVVLDPDNPHARASRGETLRALGRTAEAIEDLSAAIRLRPHESAVWSARATAYLSTNAPAKALADAQRAVELDVRNAWALAVRGLARRQANRYPTPDAVADVRRALELDPELAWARSALADWEAFLANQPAGKAAAQPDDRPAQPPDRGRQGTPGTLDPGASSAPTRSGAVLNGRRPASAPQ